MSVRQRALLALGCGVAVASIYAAQAILEPMARDLGVPAEHAGWFVAAAQLGYLIGLILLVPLGDVVADRRRLIAAHLALIAAALIATATAPVAWVAFTALAATGVLAVVVQTTVAYAASVSAPGERGRNIGVVTAGVVVGILGARVVTGALADLGGWRSVYGVLAGLSVALAALVLVALPPHEVLTSPEALAPPEALPSCEAPSLREALTPHEAPSPALPAPAAYRRAVAALGGLFSERNFLAHGLIGFLLFAAFGTLWSGYAVALADGPWHMSESRIGLFGVAGVVGALGAARAGRWADAGRAKTVTGVALALLIVSWAAIAQLPRSLWLLAAGVVILDFAVQAVHVSNQHALTAKYPDRVSSVIGGYMVFYALGSALGAAATTAVFSAHGWAGSCLLGAGFAACALTVWSIARRHPHRRAIDTARSEPLTPDSASRAGADGRPQSVRYRGAEVCGTCRPT
ncbi:MFS transporter [Nocardia cyriacigeorgica]|uniref:MFS transporter n=1 Tax=Nocardia cyriacigeorgica TaxID=135487 RepID=UPI000312F31B|nr:MFS transporter [Nocardia cyriacigeorgica]TLF53228.1 MFS transporter [Nocardia cyriacigeorgica]